MEIIAECGVNFDTVDQAFDMIEKSMDAGCAYTKFQLYDESVIKDSPLQAELAKRILSREDAQKLFDYGKSIGQPVFFTPMFIEAVDWVAEMKVPLIKIRYADHYNIELVNRVLEVGVPVLVSADRHYLAHYRNPQIKLLYCISRYPARQEEYEFVPEDFTTGAYPGGRVFAGVSDHTKGTAVMARAKECGAAFCEVHVMMLGTEPIDEAVSKTFEEVRAFQLM